MDIAWDIHKRMKGNHLLFVYRGEITERNSLPLLTLLENEMKDNSYSLTGRKRLFMFILESLQNIIKHGDHIHHRGMSLVTYSKNNNGYKISTGNVVSTENILDLKKRLDQINRLDHKATKDLYREILNASEFTGKGGAGLGLIEMAIRTGNRLDYDFIPIDAGHSYFTLGKSVDETGTGTSAAGDSDPFKGRSIAEIERRMAARGIHMVWSGHISSDIGDEVLSLAESRLMEDDTDLRLRKRVFGIMAESIENVSKYNPGKEAESRFGMPLVLVRIEDGRFVITTGNLIRDDRVDELRSKLDTVNRLDSKGLKEMFYKSLSGQTIDTDSTGIMGLLAIARKSGSRLDYMFEKVNDEYSYYILRVRMLDEPVK